MVNRTLVLVTKTATHIKVFTKKIQSGRAWILSIKSKNSKGKRKLKRKKERGKEGKQKLRKSNDWEPESNFWRKWAKLRLIVASPFGVRSGD